MDELIVNTDYTNTGKVTKEGIIETMQPMFEEFYQTVGNDLRLAEFGKFDCTGIFIINHVMPWNHSNCIVERCNILCHDTRVALVVLLEDFGKRATTIIDKIYRLQDLTPENI